MTTHGRTKGTLKEVYQVLVLLENKLLSLGSHGHDREHDELLQVEFHDSYYYFQLIQCGRVTVLVRAVDVIPFKFLLCKQLLRNESHLNVLAIKTMMAV